jgi:pimeloyl-ACP methyl ester carboxylesterase
MQERKVFLEGVELSVLEGGSGPTLLFLHGSAGRGSEKYYEPLAEHFRVVVPEIPGFGETDRVKWLKTPADVALFVRAFIRSELSGEDVTLVGHSLGGWLAAEFAVWFSSEIRSLVLVAPAGLRIADHPMKDIFFLHPSELIPFGWHDPDLAPPVPDQESMAYIRNRAMAAEIAWEPRLFDPRLAGRLRWIDVPTLVVWGQSDAILVPDYADLFRDAIPDARSVLLEEAGHYPHVEQAKQFVSQLEAFVGATV